MDDFKKEVILISRFYNATIMEETYWGNLMGSCLRGESKFRYGEICSIVNLSTGAIHLLFAAKPKVPLKKF